MPFARAACALDLTFLPSIEKSAAQAFADAGLTALLDDPPIPLAFYQGLRPEQGVIFVTDDPEGTPCGFAVMMALDHAAYLKELSVRYDMARRGHGAALLQACMAWARNKGYSQMTLTTFQNIPFNGPFYQRAGFVPFDPDPDREPELFAVRQREATGGLDRLSPRAAYRFDLRRIG